jgi:hypothetical protein
MLLSIEDFLKYSILNAQFSNTRLGGIGANDVESWYIALLPAYRCRWNAGRVMIHCQPG